MAPLHHATALLSFLDGDSPCPKFPMSLSSPLLADDLGSQDGSVEESQSDENAGTRLDQTIDRIGMGQ